MQAADQRRPGGPVAPNGSANLKRPLLEPSDALEMPQDHELAGDELARVRSSDQLEVVTVPSGGGAAMTAPLPASDKDQCQVGGGVGERPPATQAVSQVMVASCVPLGVNAAANNQASHQQQQQQQQQPQLQLQATKTKSKRTFFNPSDAFCHWWAGVVSVAFLYNFWSLSYRFAFKEIDETTVAVWFLFDYTADLIYLNDIIVNFRTGYLEDGVLQRDTKKIGIHYRESTLFYLDMLCLLPFDILYLSFSYCSILRCNKLVKIYKFWTFVDRTERHTNYPNVFRTFTLVHYILVIFHWNACLFHMISKHNVIDIATLYKINDNQCDDILCQYLHAFYWSTLALTLVGDLPRPRTRGEYIYVIVELVFGLFLFASVLGHVANIVTNVSAARKEFQAKLDAVKTFMRTRRVSDDLQNKVIRWFDYLWYSQKSSDEERSVACLPDRLKAEIAIHVNLDTLKRVDIFQNTEAGFLCELVLRLKPVLFSPGDYVCRKNEVGHEMYIVSRGRLEVVTDDGQTVVATFRAGSYFGEIAVLNVGSAGNKRTASVRSVGYSDLFCLSKRDLWDVLKDYPNAEARIRAVAEDRLFKLAGGGGRKGSTRRSSRNGAPNGGAAAAAAHPGDRFLRRRLLANSASYHSNSMDANQRDHDDHDDLDADFCSSQPARHHHHNQFGRSPREGGGAVSPPPPATSSGGHRRRVCSSASCYYKWLEASGELADGHRAGCRHYNRAHRDGGLPTDLHEPPPHRRHRHAANCRLAAAPNRWHYEDELNRHQVVANSTNCYSSSCGSCGPNAEDDVGADDDDLESRPDIWLAPATPQYLSAGSSSGERSFRPPPPQRQQRELRNAYHERHTTSSVSNFPLGPRSPHRPPPAPPHHQAFPRAHHQLMPPAANQLDHHQHQHHRHHHHQSLGNSRSFEYSQAEGAAASRTGAPTSPNIASALGSPRASGRSVARRRQLLAANSSNRLPISPGGAESSSTLSGTGGASTSKSTTTHRSTAAAAAANQLVRTMRESPPPETVRREASSPTRDEELAGVMSAASHHRIRDQDYGTLAPAGMVQMQNELNAALLAGDRTSGRYLPVSASISSLDFCEYHR